MKDFATYTALVTGIILIFGSLVMTTKDFRSTIVFKVIPFIMGVCNFIVGGRGMGWF